MKLRAGKNFRHCLIWETFTIVHRYYWIKILSELHNCSTRNNLYVMCEMAEPQVNTNWSNKAQIRVCNMLRTLALSSFQDLSKRILLFPLPSSSSLLSVPFWLQFIVRTVSGNFFSFVVSKWFHLGVCLGRTMAVSSRVRRKVNRTMNQKVNSNSQERDIILLLIISPRNDLSISEFRSIGPQTAPLNSKIRLQAF